MSLSEISNERKIIKGKYFVSQINRIVNSLKVASMQNIAMFLM